MVSALRMVDRRCAITNVVRPTLSRSKASCTSPSHFSEREWSATHTMSAQDVCAAAQTDGSTLSTPRCLLMSEQGLLFPLLGLGFTCTTRSLVASSADVASAQAQFLSSSEHVTVVAGLQNVMAQPLSVTWRGAPDLKNTLTVKE